MFVILRLCILRREESVKLGLNALPLFYGLTASFLCFFIVYKGSPGWGNQSFHTKVFSTVPLIFHFSYHLYRVQSISTLADSSNFYCCGSSSIVYHMAPWYSFTVELDRKQIRWVWGAKGTFLTICCHYLSGMFTFIIQDDEEVTDEGLARNLIVCVMSIPFINQWLVHRYLQDGIPQDELKTAFYNAYSPRGTGVFFNIQPYITGN